MKLWCAIAADFLENLMFLYVPAIYLLRPRKGGRYAVFFIFVALFTCWGIPWRHFYPPSNTVLWGLANFSVVYFLIRLLYRCDLKKSLLILLLFLIMAYATEVSAGIMVTAIIPDFLTRYVRAQFDESTMLMMHLMAALTGEIVSTVWALGYLCLYHGRRWIFFWGFMLIPIYQACLTYGFFLMCVDFSGKIALVGIGIISSNVALDGVVLYLLEGIFKKLDREEELQALAERRRQEYSYYEMDSQYVEEMRLIRHDFANQLQTVYSMMEEPENSERAKELLAEIRERIGDVE